jgi:hypothetical protein
MHKYCIISKFVQWFGSEHTQLYSHFVHNEFDKEECHMTQTQLILVRRCLYLCAVCRYNHFVSSSALVSCTNGRSNVHDILGLPVTLGPEVPTASPTSGHLSIILGLLADMLSQVCSVS